MACHLQLCSARFKRVAGRRACLRCVGDVRSSQPSGPISLHPLGLPSPSPAPPSPRLSSRFTMTAAVVITLFSNLLLPGEPAVLLTVYRTRLCPHVMHGRGAVTHLACRRAARRSCFVRHVVAAPESSMRTLAAWHEPLACHHPIVTLQLRPLQAPSASTLCTRSTARLRRWWPLESRRFTPRTESPLRLLAGCTRCGRRGLAGGSLCNSSGFRRHSV